MYSCPLYIIMKCLTNKAPWDNMQNTETVTLVNLPLELLKNSHFYYVIVSAL